MMRTKQIIYAGFWERQAALLLDLAILGLPVLVLASAVLVPTIYGTEVFTEYKSGSPKLFAEFYHKAIFFEMDLVTIAALIFALFTSAGWQATPGKKILGFKVVKSNGSRVHFFNSFCRYASLPFALFTIQTPERYFVYQKLETFNASNTATITELATSLQTPISGYTSMITIALSLYWILRILGNPEKAAIHDWLFDTRVVKAG